MQDSVKFCPQCGSASVDFSALAGGGAACKGCGWNGLVEDLLTVPIQHDFVGKEDIIRSMVNDVRTFLSGELGLPWLKFLLKWGFIVADTKNIAGTVDRKKFARYLAVIGQTVVTALIAERARQESEQKGSADERPS